MSLKIYHNPRCSKSRQTLKLIEDAGVAVEIIPYLDEPLNEAQITDILGKLGFQTARDLMRRGEAIYKELNLKGVNDENVLITAMAAHPKLIERPIVVKGNAAILACMFDGGVGKNWMNARRIEASSSRDKTVKRLSGIGAVSISPLTCGCSLLSSLTRSTISGSATVKLLSGICAASLSPLTSGCSSLSSLTRSTMACSGPFERVLAGKSRAPCLRVLGL